MILVLYLVIIFMMCFCFVTGSGLHIRGGFHIVKMVYFLFRKSKCYVKFKKNNKESCFIVVIIIMFYLFIIVWRFQCSLILLLRLDGKLNTNSTPVILLMLCFNYFICVQDSPC